RKRHAGEKWAQRAQESGWQIGCTASVFVLSKAVRQSKFPIDMRGSYQLPAPVARPAQITGLMPQIFSAYSRMLRSLENGPMLKELITALRDHASWSRNSASTRSCACA